MSASPTTPPGATPAEPTAHGAVGKIKTVSIFSYMLGDFGCNLAFSLGTTWLLFYYTDIAGISAAAVGTMFFVVRLADGATVRTDPGEGRVVSVNLVGSEVLTLTATTGVAAFDADTGKQLRAFALPD